MQVGEDLAEVEQDCASENEAEDEAGERADLDATGTLIRLALQTRAYLFLSWNTKQALLKTKRKASSGSSRSIINFYLPNTYFVLSQIGILWLVKQYK